ncbi:MAG TPA: DUF192 domain-containing protein [Candidatus Paceibacterota bacterium]|nr:DUF192 domain-containing protein [Candidatus Paceibacterota bacterium]
MTNLLITIAVAFAAIVGGVALRERPVDRPANKNATSTSVADGAYRHAQVSIGGETFDALVADTDALRDLGLGGRKGLDHDKAMLFIFDTPDYLGFWMKDMLFSIDMLWLDADMRVVSLEEDVSPKTYPKAFFPEKPARYVVEFSAGTLDALHVNVGDRASLRLDALGGK